jgi:hypothetical protein
MVVVEDILLRYVDNERKLNRFSGEKNDQTKKLIDGCKTCIGKKNAGQASLPYKAACPASLRPA